MSDQLATLVDTIQKDTAIYQEWLKSQNTPSPTFDAKDACRDDRRVAPPAVIAAIERSTEASAELHNLLVGPVGLLIEAQANANRVLILSFLRQNKIPQLVPFNGSKTFAEIAEETSLDVEDVTRLLRLAVTEHIFEEKPPGSVIHTAASKTLVDIPGLAAWMGVVTEEIWPATQKLPEAIRKWPGSQEPLESAYALAHGLEENPFKVWEKDPPRAEQFGQAMQFLHSDFAFAPEHLLANYDFDAIAGGTFVDIGGSHGQVSKMVADKFPSIKCIVQDLPATAEQGKAQLPESLNGRVEFMAHDFWTTQPVVGADIYYFRWVFHDWSNAYCHKLLRALIPALKPGARVLINDHYLPPPGFLPKYVERAPRTIDIMMKSFTNAKERGDDDWKAVFEGADARFHFLGVKIPPGAKFAIIEAVWKP